MTTMRAFSRLEFDSDSSLTHIKLGCLQRIADATELTAKNHLRLQQERDKFEGYYRQEQKIRAAIERRLAAQRGVVTKLQNQIAAMKAEKGTP